MVSKSPYPPIAPPNTDIWGLLFESDKPFPDDKVIYIDGLTKRQYTFSEVKKTASAFGHALQTQWGWGKGHVVGTFAANSIDTPIVTFGTLWATGVVSPANPGYSATELAFQLKTSEATALITQAHLLKTALEAAELAHIPRDRILLIGDEKHADAVHFTDFIKASINARRNPRVTQSPSDLAYIPFSSGTTGLPKGVMLTHRNIACNVLQLNIILNEEEMSWTGGHNGEGDVILAILPLFHSYGLTLLIHHTIYRGVKAVVLPGFVPEVFLKTIQDFKVTISYVVPPILLFLDKHPVVAEYDLSSVKWLMSAAAPLGKELILDVYERLKIPVKQAYGSTETSPGSHGQITGEWMKSLGSVGKLLPNLTAKYVSEKGEVLPKGSTGELWIKGPSVFSGYFNDPISTTNSLTSDGYYKTGDIGYEDEEGNFFITDRLKELIKYKGFQVAPAELEGILVGYNKVADACVVSIYSDAQATELPLAFVVKAAAFSHVDDKSLSDDIRAWVDGQVSNHKKLRGGIRFVDAIPKSAAGKILRRVLRDQIKAEVEAGKKKGRSKL